MNTTLTHEATRETGRAPCDCDFLRNLCDENELQQRQVEHAILLRVEELGTLEAVKLMGELALCEIWQLDADEFDKFAGQHQWFDQVQVFQIFHMFGELAEGYAERGRLRAAALAAK